MERRRKMEQLKKLAPLVGIVALIGAVTYIGLVFRECEVPPPVSPIESPPTDTPIEIQLTRHLADFEVWWDDPAVEQGYGIVACLYPSNAQLEVSWELRVPITGTVIYSGTMMWADGAPPFAGTGLFSSKTLEIDLDQPAEFELYAKPPIWDLQTAVCIDDEGNIVTEAGGQYYILADGSIAELDENGYAFVGLRQLFDLIYLPAVLKGD